MIVAAAATAMLFNLLCDGTKTTRQLTGDVVRDATIMMRPGAKQHYAIEFRVDLALKRWCFHDACDISFPIERLTDDHIVLLDEISHDERHLGREIDADRQTGTFTMVFWAPRLVEVTIGQCVKRRGAALPTTKF